MRAATAGQHSRKYRVGQPDQRVNVDSHQFVLAGGVQL
jgi:hypothetical protein